MRFYPLIRLTRHGKYFALNLTRWLYLSNHHYPGESTWYLRLGRRPGHVFTWGRDD